MSIYSHVIKDFPFDKLFKAVQTALKVDDHTFASPLEAIKKHNQPAIKTVLSHFKDKPTYKMEALFESSDINVRVLDDHNKVVPNTKAALLRNHATVIKASRELLAEEKEKHDAAAHVVATHR